MLRDEKLARKVLHSPNEKIIINGISIKDEFDDVCYGDFGFWARICRKHSKDEKYRNLGFITCEYNTSSDALCDCRDCKNEAAYYIDFFNNTPQLQVIFDNNP